MAETILTHDAGVSAFEDAYGAVTGNDDTISFNWDEQHIVHVDAPSDLETAFDTDRFYKIEDATIARPIKQPYLVGDDIEWYKKPADELRKAAWSFDNSPFTLDHPNTGMVKDVDSIHGFWRNVHYVDDTDRLNADLYVPANDEAALEWLEDNSDVSVGFYNRVVDEYDGDTGDLADDDVDGFQVDMYGNHIAGVKTGRCSDEHGCGLDDRDHGEVVLRNTQNDNYVIAPPTSDYTADGDYYAVSPNENSDGEPKYPINNCSDVDDAWQLRGHGDMDISQDTLESRIKERARELDCDVPGSEDSQDSGHTDPNSTTEDCGCTDTMGDENSNDSQEFDIPDLSIDALAEQNDAVAELTDERDSLREELDTARTEIEDTLDSAEHFTVELDDDECPCEAVDELVSDLDAKVSEVADLRDELSEYREAEIEDRLDTLDELGADRDEWADEAEDADSPLDTLDEEIERRKEVLEAADSDMSVKDIESSTDSEETTDDETTVTGSRTFGRGHNA